MSATTASEFRTGIGARLKAGRERLGMTLLQVAEKLHVDPTVVDKLEAERFGELVAPVYVKGHIKRYSELVGENTQEMLDQYSAATKPVLPDLTQLPKASHHAADPRKLVLPSLVVLIAFALIGTVWWVLQNVGKLSPPVGPQAVQTEEGISAEPSEAPGSSEIVPPASTSPETAANTARSGAAASGAGRPSAAGPAESTAPGADPTARVAATTPPPVAEAPRLKSIDVTLKFATDSWAEVYDADGKRLFYDIGSANSSHGVTGTPPLRVVLGNAPGVTVNINGRPTKVPASAVQNDGAQFTINRSGRIVRARPEEAASAASKANGE